MAPPSTSARATVSPSPVAVAGSIRDRKNAASPACARTSRRIDGGVGNWDRHVSEHFARHRTSGWNDITKVATSALNTLPVVAVAAVVVGLLALRRRWREAAFLTIALTLEITVFLSVTFVVDRP